MICSKCKKEKDEDSFYNNFGQHTKWCKNCQETEREVSKYVNKIIEKEYYEYVTSLKCDDGEESEL